MFSENFNQSLSERNSEQIERMISTIRVKSDSSKELQIDANASSYISSLGPGQILPKGINSSLRCVGELNLAVSLEKAILELKVNHLDYIKNGFKSAHTNIFFRHSRFLVQEILYPMILKQYQTHT